MLRHKLTLIFGLGLACQWLPLAAQAQPKYTVSFLTIGGQSTYAYDINDRGDVVGQYFPKDGSHAFLYTCGTMHDLRGLSAAYGINIRREIIGVSTVGRGVSWTHGIIKDLGSLSGGRENSTPNAINDWGEIVGLSGPDAFRYANGKMEHLGSLSGPSGFSNPLAVNDCGVIVGTSGHAFVYAGGRMKDLGSLGTGPNSVATAINNAGLIVGYSQTAPTIDVYGRAPPPHAFVYSAEKMVDLGTLGTGESEAYGVNDLGQIVGTIGSQLYSDSHAFIYSEGKMQDLNALVDRPFNLVLTWAKAINNRGEIIGWGYNDQDAGSFLLIPIGR